MSIPLPPKRRGGEEEEEKKKNTNKGDRASVSVREDLASNHRERMNERGRERQRTSFISMRRLSLPLTLPYFQVAQRDQLPLREGLPQWFLQEASLCKRRRFQEVACKDTACAYAHAWSQIYISVCEGDPDHTLNAAEFVSPLRFQYMFTHIFIPCS